MMNIRALSLIGLLIVLPSSAFGQAWQVPLNTIPYGKGPGQNNFGSVANTGSGTLCLLNTTPPSFGTCSGSLPTLNSGRIFVGNGSNVATSVPLSGDCTLVASGAITCLKTNGSSFGTMALQNAAAIAVTGGTLSAVTLTGSAFNGTVGATTPSTVAATTLTTSGRASISGANASIDNIGNATVYTTDSQATDKGGSIGLGGKNGSGGGFDPYTFGILKGAKENNTAGNFLGYLAVGTSDAGGTITEKLRVTGGGNVGIGTSSPSTLLDISNNTNATGQVHVTNSNSGTTAGASAAFFNNSGAALETGITSSGFTTGGAFVANRGYLFGNGATGLSIIANSVAAPIVFAAGGTAETARFDSSGNFGIGTASPATQLHTTAGVRFAGLAGAGTVCASLDAAGNMGRTACGGTGLPGAGSLSQVVLNSGAGTGAWATEPAVNISLLTGVDCTGTVATVISTAISTIKSVALPTDCTLKVTGNDTIPAGVFFSIPCGARVQVDGAAILIFDALTDDNTCQKFTASGAGAGAGGGFVKGLRFNRPEWWGAFGDCNYGGACTHDDSGPMQQAFNSAQFSNAASGDRAQVKFACGKGYGVSTGVVATATRNAPLLINGCAPLSGGNSEGGSAIYGRTAFAGIALTVTGNISTNIEIRDLEISSIDQFGTDVCLQIGSAGNTLSNASGHSLAQNLRLSYCKHLLKFAGSVVSFQFERIWMVMGNNGGASGANSSCIEAIPNAEILSELTFNSIACDGGNNSDASAICLNFHSQGASGGISGTRINDVSCYSATLGLLLQADGASSIPDFWCYSCQMDALRVNSRGFSLVTSGTGILADIVIDKSYATNTAAPFDIFNIDGSAGGTIKNIGIYGPYIAVGGALRAFRVTDAQTIQIQGARVGGTFTQQGALINDCAGCLTNNHIFSGTVPVYALLSGTTDYSQACNITANGALAPASVSGSTAGGTHNIFFGSGYQSCPNN